MTLREILHQPTKEQPDAWLYLPGDAAQWTLDTEAFLLDLDALNSDPESHEPILPPELAEKDLHEALDTRTITDCVQWADKLSGKPNDAVRLESLLYYIRFDAFLPKIGASDPPPGKEIMRRLDLEFYNALGTEDLAQPCRQEGCGRGTVKHSVFCRRHHFEMVKKRECPFNV